MPGNAAMSTDERELLANYVLQQHDGFRGAILDLTDEQAGQRIASSALSVGGLVKHAASVQVGWRLMIEAAPDEPVWPGTLEEQQANYERDNTWLEGDTVDAVLAAFDAEAERVLTAVRAADLDTPVPVPQDVPWFPRTSAPGRCAGWCCTSSRSSPGTPATPTCCARRSTARRCTS